MAILAESAVRAIRMMSDIIFRHCEQSRAIYKRLHRHVVPRNDGKGLCHAEFSSASEKILKQVQNYKGVETGRSMTEMLGVLAIIGVLSVGSIAGYRYAMDKHRANEIIHGVSMMAISASQQLENNDTFSLREFGDEVAGYAVASAVEDDGYFTITISGVSEGACEKLKNMEWKVPSEINVNGTYNGTCRDDSAIEFVFPPTLDTSGEPERDENGCYEVTYKGGPCCAADKSIKVCPGDAEPDTSCTPNPPDGCSCEGNEDKDGDAWACDISWGDWVCPNMTCIDGPDKEKCMNECRCSENPPDEGDGWWCESYSGKWVCTGATCTDGLDEGKCMNACRCSENPPDEGDGWWCDGFVGEWLCTGTTCTDGPNVGKCMNACSE